MVKAVQRVDLEEGEQILAVQTGTRPMKFKDSHNKSPEPVLREQAPPPKDSRFVDVPLPSAYMFYTWDTLSIRPFVLSDLKKIYRAHESTSLRTLMEVIDGTVDRDGTQLTIGDFLYLMYWHRINSYKRNPQTLTWECTNPDHIARTLLEPLETGEYPPDYLKPDTLHNVTHLQESNIELIHCDPDEVFKFTTEFKDTYGFYLYPPRVIDLVEGLEEAEVAPENEWINKYASVVSPSHGNLAQKREFLESHAENYGSELVADMDKFISMITHGVKETAKVECKECRAKVDTILSIDALQFFPKL